MVVAVFGLRKNKTTNYPSVFFNKENKMQLNPFHENFLIPKNKRNDRSISRWRKNKVVPPPHSLKQQVIKDFAKKFGLNILVETGTYYGDMIESTKTYFDQIYSIELSEELYQKAKQRFDGEENIKIIQGDSGVELEKLLEKIKDPTLFWLDAHYSSGVTARGDKDTPIIQELTHIFNTNLSEVVIIIDDARIFGHDPAYPSIKELNNFVKTNRPNANIEIKDDSIRITASQPL